jgi:uncharacterized heparinase superfamily protein
LSKLGIYFHTIRYLRPVQIAARVWHRVYRVRPDLRPPPCKRPLARPYVPPIRAAQTLVAPDTLRLLNVERRCATAADWHPADATKLWTYHLHYFDDLNSRDSEARTIWHQQLLERWVSENAPGTPDGWESYPLSRRLVNWVKWAARGGVLPRLCPESMAVQARWLSSRLEYHLLGNHLLANAKALVHAGLYFEGAEAERWYERGMNIVREQLREQVLGDGGHFERSTMYHALVLEDLLDLINLLRTYDRRTDVAWYDTVARMRRWLLLMSHPDGDIAFFNDAAFGVAATPAQLEAYATRLNLGPPPQHDAALAVLGTSGYVRVAAGPAYLICDCAPLGPPYLPAHGHADTLSFELSLAEQRVFVNSGVSEYGEQPERLRQRGTAAHNTVLVNGQNSSEVWGAFRVARRARAHLVRARATSGTTIEAYHDGYARLPGHNVHTRSWTLEPHLLRIEDRITGDFQHAEARFHLHPAIEARIGPQGEVILRSADAQLAIMTFTGAPKVEINRGTWHPRFGVAAQNDCISVRFAASSLTSLITWAAPQ